MKTIIKSLNNDLKIIFAGMGIINAIIVLLSLIFRFRYVMILGLTVGFIFSCFNLLFLNNAISKAIDMSIDKAKKYMYVNYIIRISILLIISFIVYKINYISVIGIIITLFYPKIVIFFITVFVRKEGEK